MQAILERLRDDKHAATLCVISGAGALHFLFALVHWSFLLFLVRDDISMFSQALAVRSPGWR